MIFEETALAGAFRIELEKKADGRGFFARTFCAEEFAAHGLTRDFAQSSLSVNLVKGTLRGLHFQAPPHGETKLVRCSRGAILDVILDIRPQSPSFRRWLAFELSAQAGSMLYIPEGFAHGFQTLTDDVEVSYMITPAFAAGFGRGIAFDDPALAIPWPLPVSRISDQDRRWPALEQACPQS